VRVHRGGLDGLLINEDLRVLVLAALELGKAIRHGHHARGKPKVDDERPPIGDERGLAVHGVENREVWQPEADPRARDREDCVVGLGGHDRTHVQQHVALRAKRRDAVSVKAVLRVVQRDLFAHDVGIVVAEPKLQTRAGRGAGYQDLDVPRGADGEVRAVARAQECEARRRRVRAAVAEQHQHQQPRGARRACRPGSGSRSSHSVHARAPRVPRARAWHRARLAGRPEEEGGGRRKSLHELVVP